MKIEKSDLKKVSENLMFDIPDKEIEKFLTSLDSIKSKLEIIENLKIARNTKEMIFPFDVSLSIDDDLFYETFEQPSKGEMLKNSKHMNGDKVRIKKVIK